MYPNSQNQRSPYIIGTAIRNIDQLFGREILLRTIADSLQQDAKFILLHGQRRIGKSSVLRNIHHFVSQDEFVFVSCDFQEHGHATLGQILYAIANAIVERLSIDSSILNTLKPIDLDNNPKFLAWRLLPTVYETLNNKKLVLLLDEFDVVTQNDTEQAVEFLRFLEKLVKQQDDLFVIAVVGRYLNAMPNLLQSFRGAPFYEIGLLDNNDAQQLITQPAENILTYQEQTITEILKVSSGHPFCTQVLCHEIFKLVRNQNNLTNPTIVLPDRVLEVIPDAIESAGGGLDSIWNGLSISEKVVILAIAEAQRQNAPENPFKLLEASGLVLTDSLEEAIQLLINKVLLDNNSPIKIKVELFRIWLLQRYQLRDEIRNLEALELEKVTPLLSVARSCWQEGKQQNALNLYEDALQLNPNNLSTIVELAEKYLQVENFDKALQLYERADKLDPGRYEQQFVEALNKYGHCLITQNNYVAAKQQYEKIKQLQPENSLAQQKLAEIKAYEDHTNIIYIGNLIRQNYRLVILMLIGSISIFGMIFFGFSKLSINCPSEQEKSSDGRCIARNIINTNSPGNSQENNPISNNISSGDRTLFPGIKNSDRDKGIAFFKQENYQEAEKSFRDAVKYNPNDPEVLIYQNNARAIQQANPLTLAAVVSAKNRTDLGLGMLRGIAQAQNQFNEQGGLNGRLLEIVIADDENKANTAELVAQELVKDKYKSILGVIGHSSSHVTKAALSIYEGAKLPIISPASSSTKLQESKFFFRTVPSDEATGKKLTEYALKLKINKAIIFCNPDDPYSNSIREEFRAKFETNDRKIFEKPCINITASNFNKDTIKTQLSQYKPQAILLFPDTQHLQAAITIIKAQKEWLDDTEPQQRPDIKLLGGASLYSNKILQEGGDGVEGLVIGVPWFRNAVKSINFTQKAEKQWGGKIDDWYTATSFDATQAFIESFKLSPNVSTATVLANLPNVKLSSNHTSGEELIFDKNTREMKRDEKLLMVKNGKFVVIPEEN